MRPIRSITAVPCVEEAVALADRWFREGRYDWFRGQGESWPLRSTLHRAAESGMGELAVIEKLSRLSNKAQNDPALAWLLDESRVHDFFACAQHYGVPT